MPTNLHVHRQLVPCNCLASMYTECCCVQGFTEVVVGSLTPRKARGRKQRMVHEQVCGLFQGLVPSLLATWTFHPAFLSLPIPIVWAALGAFNSGIQRQFHVHLGSMQQSFLYSTRQCVFNRVLNRVVE